MICGCGGFILRTIAPICAAMAFVLPASLDAAAATIDIVAFGDSATAGYLVRKHDAYPAQLQAALRANGYEVRVANAGLNGDTTFGALVRLDSAVSRDTDVVIVEFGVNDRRRGTSLQTVRANLDQLLHRLNERRIETLVIGLGRLDLSGVARANGALYVQWRLPRGKYRARDGAHFNAEGYRILVRRMLPTVEKLIERVAQRKRR